MAKSLRGIVWWESNQRRMRQHVGGMVASLWLLFTGAGTLETFSSVCISVKSANSDLCALVLDFPRLTLDSELPSAGDQLSSDHMLACTAPMSLVWQEHLSGLREQSWSPVPTPSGSAPREAVPTPWSQGKNPAMLL